MKNNESYEFESTFDAAKRLDKSYGTDSAVSVLCRAYGCLPEDVKGGKFLQVDHIVPQNVHLDPKNDLHAEFIEALGLEESLLSRVNGKLAYTVAGSDLIRAAFKNTLPESMIPSQDNIINLCILPTPANRVKSNKLPSTLEAIRNTLFANGQALLAVIEKMETEAQPRASRLARNIGVPVEMPSDYRITGPHGEDRHLVLTGEFERCVDAFSKEYKQEIWILDDAQDLKNGFTSLPGSFEEARENDTFTLRILNQEENDIAHVLHAIEAVDKVKDEDSKHLLVPNVNLFEAFDCAARMVGEDKYYLKRLTAFLDEEMLVDGNYRVADKLANQGIRLEPGFTGSVVDAGKRFYDSFASFKKEFLPFAESRIQDIREERIEERMAGIPVFQAA